MKILAEYKFLDKNAQVPQDCTPSQENKINMFLHIIDWFNVSRSLIQNSITYVYLNPYFG